MDSDAQHSPNGPDHNSPAPINSCAHRLNILAYVHLRNIHESTGAGRVARQLTEHVAVRNDTNLHILADANDCARILPLVGKPWIDYSYHTFANDTSRQQTRWFLLNRPAAEDFWPEAKIVFCTAESYVPVRTARLAVTLHDAAYFEDGAHRKTTAFWKQRLKWKLLFGKMEQKVDMFHTVSHFSAERLGHFFPKIASRIRVVHNAVTPHFFEPVPEEGRRYLADNGLCDREYILVPGGLQYRKNAELILEAALVLRKRFPSLTIVISGHSDPIYVDRVKAISPTCQLLGFVNDSALNALYTNASLVWFPSRYEGFGLPVVEAMACGSPVVCSNAASLPEIAGNAAVLVDSGNPVAHANAIEMLLTDSRARQDFSGRGRARAATFTWASSAEKLMTCFRGML